MLATDTLSSHLVIQTADTFANHVDVIKKGVEACAGGEMVKFLFDVSLDNLQGKVKEIGSKARNVQSVSPVDPIAAKHLRRLCEGVGDDLATIYQQIAQNVSASSLDDELFFDYLGQLEMIWCSPDAPLHTRYTQIHDPVPPQDIEALDDTDFLKTLEECSNAFGGHPVSCFISYTATDSQPFAAILTAHLKMAGVDVKIDTHFGSGVPIQNADYVIVLGSAAYGKEAAAATGNNVRDETPSILQKYSAKPERVLRALIGGNVLRSFPPTINHTRTDYADFRQIDQYHTQVIDLLERLYRQAGNSSFFTERKPAQATQVVSKRFRASARTATTTNLPPPLKHFTGRTRILKKLASLFSRPGERKVALLHGLRGMGKTEIAIVFATQTRPLYDHILLIDWTSATTIQQSYRDIQDTLKTYNHSDSLRQDSPQQLVFSRLAHTHKKFLILLDHVSNPLVADDMPPGPHHLIITSTREDVCSGEKFLVGPLSSKRGRQLFCKVRGKDEGATDIANMFAGLPFAIEQAALCCRGTSISAREYVDTYSHAPLTSEMQVDPARYTESLSTIWAQTLERIALASPLAHRILQTLCFFHPYALPTKEIPEFGLPVRRVLMRFAAIRPAGQGLRTSFYMHPMLQHCVRQQLAGSVDIVCHTMKVLQTTYAPNRLGLIQAHSVFEGLHSLDLPERLANRILEGLFWIRLLNHFEEHNSATRPVNETAPAPLPFDLGIPASQMNVRHKGMMFWLEFQTDPENHTLPTMAQEIRKKTKKGSCSAQDMLGLLAVYRYYRLKKEYRRAKETLKCITTFCNRQLITADDHASLAVARSILNLVRQVPIEEKSLFFKEMAVAVQEKPSTQLVCCLAAIALLSNSEDKSEINFYVDQCAEILQSRKDTVHVPPSTLRMLAEAAQWCGNSSAQLIFSAEHKRRADAFNVKPIPGAPPFKTTNELVQALETSKRCQVDNLTWTYRNKDRLVWMTPSCPSRGLISLENQICAIALSELITELATHTDT